MLVYLSKNNSYDVVSILEGLSNNMLTVCDNEICMAKMYGQQLFVCCYCFQLLLMVSVIITGSHVVTICGLVVRIVGSG